MKTLMKSFFFVALFGAMIITQADAQRNKGRVNNRGCNYNLATEEEMTGEIVSIEKIKGRRGNYHGIHLTVKSNTKETIEVHLGPNWYIEDQAEQLQIGDEIFIKGSRCTYNNKPALVAAQIKRGDFSLLLRDERGRPLWRGKKGKKM